MLTVWTIAFIVVLCNNNTRYDGVAVFHTLWVGTATY